MNPKKTTWIEVETFKNEKLNEAALRRRQMVQTETGHLMEKARPDAFLGEKNQEVDRELVSRNRSIEMARANKLEARTKEKSKGALSELGIPVLPNFKSQPLEQPKDTPQWADASTTPQDFARGVKEGDRTTLNTKEFVYYGYYQRIRERLDRAWVPILRERLLRIYKTGRTLASDMDHSTRVLVVLNLQGEVVRVRVMTESGSTDLDDAAVSAFSEAGPFPNPPKGIIDTTGEIQIPWEFILRT